MTKSIILICFLFLVGCSNSKKPSSKYDYSGFEQKIANNKNYDVFSFSRRLINKDNKDTNAVLEPNKNALYSYFLTAFREGNLLEANSDTIIRFLWLRTFDKPVLIKIFKDKSLYKVETKITNGTGGYIAGTQEYFSQIIINDSIRKNLFDEKFFQIIYQHSLSSYSKGSDGAYWLLEFKIGKKYYFKERWSPTVFAANRDSMELKTFENYCLKIIKLANYPINRTLSHIY